MKKLLPILLLAVFGCHKDNLEPRPFEFGSIAFNMIVPNISTTAKVPSCKDIEPNEVAYSMTNGQGQPYTYSSPLGLIGNAYVSTPNKTLPFGNYTVTDVLLMNGNDTIYALPHEDEIHLSPYWSTTLPMTITVNGDEVISGNVFCFNEYTLPEPLGNIESNFNARKMQSLYFSVFDNNCIDRIVVDIDGFITKNLLIPGKEVHHISVPLEYTRMDIKAYIGNDVVQFYRFTPSYRYNGDGVMEVNDLVMFNYICI